MTFRGKLDGDLEGIGSQVTRRCKGNLNGEIKTWKFKGQLRGNLQGDLEGTLQDILEGI